jgi:Putative auto-transporter adhesin, head GIN domain
MRVLLSHRVFFRMMAALFCCALAASCNRENAPDCFQSAGTQETIQRDLDSFSSLELNDYIQYELLDTNYYGVLITAPGNLLSDIETIVADGVLKVENTNRCNFVRSFKNKITVRICAPDFIDIQNYATGDIVTIGSIQGSKFSIENRGAAGTQRLSLYADTVNVATHTGVCDAIVEGACTSVYLFNQGLGTIDSRDLVSRYAYVNNSSLNDVYVHASDYLFGYVQFSGSIFYLGNPSSIDTDIEGEGDVVSY